MGNLSIFSSFSMFFDFIYYMLIVNKIFEGVSATPVRSNQTNKSHHKAFIINTKVSII